MKKRHAVPRRRPGDFWDLWRVVGRDKGTNVPKAIGYLVTERGKHAPQPIAFVRGVDGRSLRKAVSIRQDHSRAARAMDMRRCSWDRYPRRQLLGMLLIPVGRSGHAITNAQIDQAIYQKWDGRIALNCRIRDRRKAKSSSSAEHTTLKLGSKGDEARTLAAA